MNSDHSNGWPCSSLSLRTVMSWVTNCPIHDSRNSAAVTRAKL